jgi:hypothetical protein
MPLPSAIDAERHLLGVLLRDALPLPEGLLPSDFHEPKHQDTAACIKALAEAGTPPDELVVTNKLREAKSTAEAHYISELTTTVGSSLLNPGWADLIKRKAALRQISLTASRLLAHANEEDADPEALVAFTEGSLKAAKGRAKPRDTAELMPLSTLRAFDLDNDPTCLVGNRWLCKGGSLLLVSQSGVGKSSFTLQMLISLAVGRPFFGIQAKRPLRIVMGQAENDVGDVAHALQSICSGMMLYPDEERLLDENLHIYRDTHSVGPAFIERMRELIIRHNADWFTCDPLMSFCGIEVSDQKQMTEFLRHGINPVLEETGAVFMAVHHTTKPRSAKDKEGQTVADLAYAGSGSSELTNWSREVACLQRCPGDEPVFKFALTKRRGRAGLKDHADDFANEITIRHARQKGVVRWEYAIPEEATAPQTATRPASRDADSSPAKGSPRRFDSR